MESLCGQRIVASINHIEASLARADEAALLGIRRGASVLLEWGVVYAEDSTSVRSSAAVYRGDRFRLAVSAEKKPAAKVKLPGHSQLRELGDQWLELSLSPD
jgi:hypothetical protein